MLPLFLLFWNIALLRTGPNLVPESSGLLLAIVLAHLLTDALTGALLASALPDQPELAFDLLRTLTLSTVSLAVIAAGIWLPLRIRRFSHRFTITLTAVFGCGLVISLAGLFALPLSARFGMAILPWLSLGLLVWWIAAIGSILTRAAEVSSLQAHVLAFCLVLLAILVAQMAALPTGVA